MNTGVEIVTIIVSKIMLFYIINDKTQNYTCQLLVIININSTNCIIRS